MIRRDAERARRRRARVRDARVKRVRERCDQGGRAIGGAHEHLGHREHAALGTAPAGVEQRRREPVRGALRVADPRVQRRDIRPGRAACGEPDREVAQCARTGAIARRERERGQRRRGTVREGAVDEQIVVEDRVDIRDAAVGEQRGERERGDALGHLAVGIARDHEAVDERAHVAARLGQHGERDGERVGAELCTQPRPEVHATTLAKSRYRLRMRTLILALAASLAAPALAIADAGDDAVASAKHIVELVAPVVIKTRDSCGDLPLVDKAIATVKKDVEIVKLGFKDKAIATRLKALLDKEDNPTGQQNAKAQGAAMHCSKISISYMMALGGPH